MKLYVVRHAHAGSRGQWEGDDRARPLSEQGTAQANGLVELLGGEPIERILSSPAVRCVQTVEPLAVHRELTVEPHDTLFEGSWVTDVVDLVESFDAPTVVCSHGDVIPDLLRGLTHRGMEVLDPLRWAKGSTWVIERDGDRWVDARYLPTPTTVPAG